MLMMSTRSNYEETYKERKRNIVTRMAKRDDRYYKLSWNKETRGRITQEVILCFLGRYEQTIYNIGDRIMPDCPLCGNFLQDEWTGEDWRYICDHCHYSRFLTEEECKEILNI